MTQKFVTLPREVVELAINALYCTDSQEGSPAYNFELKAVKELRAALEQPQAEQEPVAWALSHSNGLEFSSNYPMQKSMDAAEQMARKHMGAVTVTPLYTHPQPKREPLTDEQIEKICPSFDDPMRREMWKIGFKAAHNIK